MYMTKGYAIGCYSRFECGHDELLSHPCLLRHEEKILRPGSPAFRIEPSQARFLRRAVY
jgi:hypothetical protein